ncbi:uncharacterized protein LOC110250675 [Exaiptasia diaphana]|uniref:Phytanoyl-CoA dioxygenase n=1 Tax=Exaiptasia diaphana TaxID=2652724 RepID=A0A913Y0T1_EXADI|nr:uncharacterized protein LOC110250675 [Exaiptasia diaphana]
MEVLLGKACLGFRSPDLQELQDCNDILDNRHLLLEQLHDKGYLFIRQLHDRQEVLQARRAVLEYLSQEQPNSFDTTRPLEEAVLNKDKATTRFVSMEGKNTITHSKALLKVFEGERIKAFFRLLFAEEPKTFDYKWLRAIHQGGFTGAHVDNVYMSRGTNKLLTCWTPIGDVTMDMGTLAMCEGSHRLPEFSYFQETYGSMDLEKEGVVGSGWFTEDANEITTRFGGQWKTANFQAGDVLVFTQRTVHMSSVNTSHYARISCDTRWLPMSEIADSRYVGDFDSPERPKYGIEGRETKTGERNTTMDTKKKQWGFL